MRPLLFLLLTLSLPAQTWTNLFDGKSLTGWQPRATFSAPSTGDWKIDNNAIYCGGASSGWLHTNAEYKDFRLQLEFRGPDNSLGCEPGEKVSVTDGAGSGVRTCGWKGKAFVVTLKRDRGPKREDRYELDGAGQQLVHTTQLSGGRMPDATLRRVYTRASAP